MTKRILLSSPHMGGTEQKYIQEAFDTNWIAPLGANVDGFEHELASYVKVKAASATSSGTGAIHLALDLLGVRAGDTVFCSTLTFIASANPILYLGATPVFIDSEESTWNMSPKALERALSEAKANGLLPKAVIVVNLYGQSARMDELMALCNEYNVPIIEDAAESLGSLYKGKHSGTFGVIGIYSFNGNKIITTSGGGMLVSNDEQLIARSRFLATQARDAAKHYQHSVVGYNYRMSNVVAGIGRGQLEVLDERISKKREIFKRYETALANIDGIMMMPELEGTFSNRWLSTMTLDPKKIKVTPYKLIDLLNEANIEARPVWKPLHMQPLFSECKFYAHGEGQIVSEELFANGICLPSDSKMTVDEQQKVIDIVLNCV
ncbi:aminotransferase class I/II-fold pyridoxal phosphate-dependent enzyme [Metasolibacillus sp.]|uniref:aminotransferase class I/II-fold pyridoxal phosphate-dependent enzyme n=1 Tax=Metasolibacillus sp. TaxID=2703680 RepID=UPI0025D6438D|nr:aminotransferase class I/II-fold pyridoxal phosphate-dependent enzyme [Metasolibacillus sp.]MCT6923375.1 aminotransferase class I/II-fold pyridoxal phosphate-dependent enzyme [Metasolibacillus sp.]MCT6939902.1 aminotransferase class I/II-fold pyridoxal phosphate-dependent enzyme [Metasolibacillus sp.]